MDISLLVLTRPRVLIGRLMIKLVKRPILNLNYYITYVDARIQ